MKRVVILNICFLLSIISITFPQYILAEDYLTDIQQLADYFLKNEGNPPNATKLSIIDGKMTIAAYHVYQDNETHLYSGGATTSEGQTLFFNFMTLYAAITNDTTGMWGAYNYIKYYMMPHDGLQSPELPDGQLNNDGYEAYMPYLVQWLVNISPTVNINIGGTCNNIPVGINTTYKIYDGCPYICLNPLDDNRYKFGSALDADQWIISGFYWAEHYNLGDFKSDKIMFGNALYNCLSRTENRYTYENVMVFGDYWGATKNGNWGWRDKAKKDLYSGYQDPACWYVLNEHSVASQVVTFLKDAQDTFHTRYDTLGPFMPVYSDENSGFGWNGADPNTHWTGFQYRSFAHLANYFYLTGDPTAKDILSKFYNWLKSHWTDNGGKISIPTSLYNGKDGHDEGATGTVESTEYSPNGHALCAQALIYLAKKTGDPVYKKDAEVLLNDLVINRKNEMGSYTSDDDLYYGFQNSEVGIALCLYELFYGLEHNRLQSNKTSVVNLSAAK